MCGDAAATIRSLHRRFFCVGLGYNRPQMEGVDDGIALRVIPYSESSVIVHWLTWRHGRIATMAKGARRPKSAMFGRIDLFLRANLVFRPSRRSTLHTLIELEVDTRLPRFHGSIQSVSLGAYWFRLIERLTETDTPLDGVAALCWECLCALDATGPNQRLQLLFELRLLQNLGFFAASHDPRVSAPARPWYGFLVEENADRCLSVDWPDAFTAELQDRMRTALVEVAPETMHIREKLRAASPRL